MREVNKNPGASSPCVFHRSDVNGSALVHRDDFATVTRRWHAKEVEKHLRSKAPEEMKLFQADAARGNNLSMDRPDLQFSAKEISRAMPKPMKKDVRKTARMENGEVLERS